MLSRISLRLTWNQFIHVSGRAIISFRAVTFACSVPLEGVLPEFPGKLRSWISLNYTLISLENQLIHTLLCELHSQLLGVTCPQKCWFSYIGTELWLYQVWRMAIAICQRKKKLQVHNKINGKKQEMQFSHPQKRTVQHKKCKREAETQFSQPWTHIKAVIDPSQNWKVRQEVEEHYTVYGWGKASCTEAPL